ncbi:PD-(D/E)XK nuclease family protein [Miniphocaeibacter halophilus]|uniref:PD-(D/E)XK nuclease family protein n=1 Tax=Miniphocaeibacter halophilus TaxID=2931922 RepID=A0AC61MZ77_9FIRM|nr:PD-(D/E)XK nuclease family protein [Miniphocaeibacter halophilus]QQK07493.1 PD-(D/E)XK nuclease family protein [Miniphocaeibacter halophilus]
MFNINLYKSSNYLYDNLKENIFENIKNNDDFIVILPNKKIIERLRVDIVSEFEAVLNLKLFTFDDLINYKNTGFVELENMDYLNSLIMQFSIQNCINKGIIDNNYFYNSDGFLAISLKLINYIKSSIISIDDLEEKVKNNSSLFSVFKIFKEYNYNMSKYNLQDRYDKYNSFLNSKLILNELKNVKRIYIAGFLDFRKIEYTIIEFLKKYINNIEIYIQNALNEKLEIYNDTIINLLNLSFKINNNNTLVDKTKSKLKIIKAEDKFLEVKRLAIEIKKDLLEDSNKSCAIIINDDEYKQLILERFKEEEIPIQSTSKINIKDTNFGKWMYLSLDNNIDIKDYIIGNLNNPFIFSDNIENLEIENMIYKILPNTFEELFNSNILRTSNDYNLYFNILNKIYEIYSINNKEQLIGFVKFHLDKIIEKDEEEIEIYEKFYKFIENLELRYSNILNQMEYSEFKKYFLNILKEYFINENSLMNCNIELIDFNNYKLLNHEYLYFLGCNDNSYPKKETINYYFNSKNNIYLRKLGIDILTNRLKQSKDKLNFFNILNCNVEKFYISFEDSGKNLLSDFIYEYEENVEIQELYSLKDYINPKNEFVLNNYDKNLYISMFKEPKNRIDDFDGKIEIPEKEESDSYSSTKLETYLLCPVKYYYKYVLKLEDCFIDKELNKILKLGTACHEALKTIYKDYLIEKNKLLIKEDFIIKILKKNFEELDINTKNYEGLNTLKRYGKNLENTIKEDFKYLDKFQGNITPYKFEESFTFSKVFNIDGVNKNIKFIGRIDRIDRDLDNNFYLVDYKLGKNSFKTIRDFKNRKTLQFPIYSLINNIQGCRYITIKDSKVHEFYMTKNNIHFDNNSISNESLNNLRNETLEIIEEILNNISKEEFFIGTSDNKNCRFCQYYNICKYRG